MPSPTRKAVPLSSRTAWDTTDNALAHAVHDARQAGRSLVDLTLSNPTRCGFTYDAEAILGAMRSPAALTYEPDPCGLLVARESVAGYYRDHDAALDPSNVVLTTSTSEAYSFLFRLLCDAGDAVLAPQPSYPLFDFVAALDDVQLVPYTLFHDFGWWIDFAALEEQIASTTRAILVVHPNNPTGHPTGRAERTHLQELCVRHGLALIVDEVFLDYKLHSSPEPRIESFARGPHPCLTFVISGLSKIAALPQMKVAWIAAFGPTAQTDQVLSRLEVISDTYLSMSTPVQHALPTWLAGRRAVQEQILERLRANLALLQSLSSSADISVYPVLAGWCAILRVSRRLAHACGEQGIALSLIHEAGVVVHPGAFYGIGEGASGSTDRHIVLSLIGEHAAFQSGISLLKNWIESKRLT